MKDIMTTEPALQDLKNVKKNPVTSITLRNNFYDIKEGKGRGY